MIAILILAFVASIIGTITGFGISTLMIPLMAFFYAMPQTLLFVGVVHTLNDVWKTILYRKALNVRLIFFFGLPGVVASYVGARTGLSLATPIVSRLLGIFLMLYVIFLLMRPTFTLRATSHTAMLGGTLSGFSAGIFGMGGALRTAFLSLFNLDKAIFIATSGAIGILIDSIRLGTYYAGGVRLDESLWIALLWCLPISLIGAFVGQMIVDKIPQQYFRLIIASFLFLVGFKLFLFP